MIVRSFNEDAGRFLIDFTILYDARWLIRVVVVVVVVVVSNDEDNRALSPSTIQAASLGRERKPQRHNLLPGPQLLHDRPSPVKSRKTI